METRGSALRITADRSSQTVTFSLNECLKNLKIRRRCEELDSHNPDKNYFLTFLDLFAHCLVHFKFPF